jgi:hypothetical protein
MRAKLSTLRSGKLKLSGYRIFYTEYFHVITAHTVDGEVVFMNDQLARSMHPSCPPHAGEAG